MFSAPNQQRCSPARGSVDGYSQLANVILKLPNVIILVVLNLHLSLGHRGAGSAQTKL